MAAHVGQLAPRKPSSASLNAFGCLRVLKEASAGAGRAGDAQPVVEVDRAEGINPTSARRPPPPELEEPPIKTPEPPAQIQPHVAA
jgi:hypothetical protein